jgi:hypothetical protein
LFEKILCVKKVKQEKKKKKRRRKKVKGKKEKKDKKRGYFCLNINGHINARRARPS